MAVSVSDGMSLRESALHGAVWVSALLVSAAFLLVVGDVLVQGSAQISWSYLLDAPADSGRAGGIAPILVSTSLILGVCIAVALPLGLGTAALIAEFTPGRSLFGRLVRISLDTLAGVPSIVFGMFGNAFFCSTLGLGFSILSGGLTLACMVLPVFIRTAETGFSGIPDAYRENAFSLGLSRIATFWHILLPMAAPAIAVGLVLAVGRALAETAALIFTSGYVDRMPASLSDSGRALSIHIFDLSMNVPGGDRRAYAAAFVLLVILLLVNVSIQSFADRFRRRRLTF